MAFDTKSPSSNCRGFLFSRRGWILLALFFLTLLCVVEMLLFRHFHPEQGRDAILYIAWIRKWHVSGFERVIKEWPDFWLPPFYLYLVHLCMYLGLSSEAAGVAVSMCCATLMPLVVFGIAYEITRSAGISLSAALLAAVHPTIIEYGCTVLREVAYLCFMSIVLYFFLAGIRRGKWYFFFLSGAFLAPALLTRYETAEFIPALLLYVGIALFFRQEKRHVVLRNAAVWGAALCLGFWTLCQMMQIPAANMTERYRVYFNGRYLHLLRSYHKKTPPAPPKDPNPAPKIADDGKMIGKGTGK